MNWLAVCVACAALAHGVAVVQQVTTIAQWAVVDYKWTATHTRADFIAQGLFKPEHNIITGIKVSPVSGDLFVTVPRWRTGVPSSLNKLVVGKGGVSVLDPWPTWEFNAVGSPGGLKYAQSMWIDQSNVMWIPDVGRTNFFDPVKSTETVAAAAMIRVNVSSGVVLSTYTFPSSVFAPNASFANDMVLDEARSFAYLSNTWGDGGVIVYDHNTQTSRAFVGPSTMRNASYDFCVNDACYGQNSTFDVALT
jgi:hypothetical protein